VPVAPTATNCVPDQATALSWWVAGSASVRSVQATPSGEVSTMPMPPTMTRVEPDDATPRRSLLRPTPALGSRLVQVTPSGEVTMVQVFPTATYCEPVQATVLRFSVTFEVWLVQAVAFGEVATVPPAPTATNCESFADQARPSRGILVAPGVQVMPSAEVLICA